MTEEEENLDKRRNGKFTCLNCKKNKRMICSACVSKNWEKFELKDE
jgi:hypothetical protein